MTLAVPRAVTVVGGANMDISAQAGSALAAGDSIPGSIHYSPGGVGRNMAENLARLGVPVRLLTVLGQDAFGQALREATLAAGVAMDCALSIPGYRTATYLSMHGPDGEVAMAVNDMEILQALTPDLCAASPALAQGEDLLLADCNLPAPTLAYLLALGRPVAVDGVSVAKCVRVAGQLHGLFLLKLNHMEAHALTGLEVRSPEDAQRAAQALQAQGVQRVLISLGAQGVCWADVDATPQFRASRPVTVRSATGAGDALMAGVIAALQREEPLGEAVAYGMTCAEITLSSTFANSPDLNHAAVLQQQPL